jgi:hypothetical protein
LRERATELTQVISEDLATGLDLASAQTQAEVAGAISGAREDLSSGISELPTWKSLSALSAALGDEAITALRAAADEAEPRSPKPCSWMSAHSKIPAFS